MRKSSAHSSMLLCELCQDPFSAYESTALPHVNKETINLHLCPKHDKIRSHLVVLTCAGCGSQFPRLKSIVKKRKKEGCTKSYCPGCLAIPSEKEVTVICTECGRSYKRSKKTHIDSIRRGYKRCICPNCRAPKLVEVRCQKCKRVFHRKEKEVREKRKRGYKYALCPKCSGGPKSKRI